MKKLLCIAMVLMMAFATLAGCAGTTATTAATASDATASDASASDASASDAAAAPAASTETIKVGILGPHTGDYAVYGLAVKNGAQLYIDQVNAARADLGALQTRFEKSIENIDIMNENITAARGRIVDADFATETANLSRAQILQQAGTAMVAQANQLPQQVLSLLQ